MASYQECFAVDDVVEAVTSGQNNAIPSEESSFTYEDVLADSLTVFERLSDTIDMPNFQSRASLEAIYQRCLLD